MKSKIISVFLAVAVLLSQVEMNQVFAMEDAAFSMENDPVLTTAQVVEEKPRSFYKRHKASINTMVVSTLTAAGSLCGYLLGYKNGGNDHIENMKEIHLSDTGSKIRVTRKVEGDRQSSIFYALQAKQYINQLFLNDVPNLSKMDTFPSEHLKALINHQDNLSFFFNDELGDQIRALSQIISQRTSEQRNEPMTIGYLKDLLNQSKKLIDKAYIRLHFREKKNAKPGL